MHDSVKNKLALLKQEELDLIQEERAIMEYQQFATSHWPQPAGMTTVRSDQSNRNSAFLWLRDSIARWRADFNRRYAEANFAVA